MTIDEVNLEIDKINTYLSNCLWMDFEICQMNFIKTVMSGRIDSSSDKYMIDIEFEQPHFISSLFTWTADTSKPFIGLASEDEFVEMNKKYRIEQGNYVFKIYMEDFEDSAIFIASKKIVCNIINNDSYHSE